MAIQTEPMLTDCFELLKSAEVRPFQVIGHRGARGLMPENTIAAFALATRLGVDALELDVGLTADGVLVVAHDPEISHTLCLNPDGSHLKRYPRRLIRKLTLAEVQQFDCGSLNPNPMRFPEQQLVPGERIPTLAQVFEHQMQHFPDSQVKYTIECKVNPLRINPLRSRDTFGASLFAKKLVNLVREYGLSDRVTIQSFEWRVLRAVKNLEPQIQTAALIRQYRNKPGTLLSQARIASPFLAGFDFKRYHGNIAALVKETGFIDRYSPNFETLIPESRHFIQSVQEIQKAGFPVIPWTVNDATKMQRLIDLGVDGLITDYPNVLINLLRKRGMRDEG
ncbi:glycerophosphodiester phosphodiesterase family protein [Phormidesmis sp. 146-35]